MFEILFLGTSASAPSANRGLSSHIVSHNEYRFLVDCGEGTQRQILQSGKGFKRLTRALITHGHLDHILGLGGLLSTFMRWEAIEEFEIYASRGTLERVRTLLYDVVLRGKKTPMPLRLVEIQPGVIFEAEDFTVTAFPVTHRGADSLGYVFEEKARRPFLAEKADALGVPFGPERKALVTGETIQLPDGKRVTPDDVLGDLEKGAKLVIVGDTGRIDNLIEICKDADMVVIESTYLDEEEEMAEQFSHLTAKMGAELAKNAGVKRLILTHISRRYRGKDVLAEAQTIFQNTAVARDFDTYVIKKEI
ncbi:MAG: ribonuclease Z [Anaerolineales bacterium]|nr:MAG: ribonuclease Z [Chloroflexota bacterium]MBE7433006.1 ribonuclease Z [Anaerolineales bacterium]MCE7859729.1 ribonuclease Z [Chloroflexi bacterium CFX2]MCK6583456.1 ribonuclease Z [Anaerolineales bacterium]GJQ35355.1 MAG: ribonuclease Z [Anaerolineaceae bacterium]